MGVMPNTCMLPPLITGKLQHAALPKTTSRSDAQTHRAAAAPAVKGRVAVRQLPPAKLQSEGRDARCIGLRMRTAVGQANRQAS